MSGAENHDSPLRREASTHDLRSRTYGIVDREDDTEFVLYRTAREVAVKVLYRIERTDSYLDKVLDLELKISDLDKADKDFLALLVKGTVRWKLKLDHTIAQFYGGDLSKADINVKNVLRLAVYQLMFLVQMDPLRGRRPFGKGMPEQVVIDEAVKFVKRLRGETSANAVNAALRAIVRKINLIDYPVVDDDPVKALSTIHSFPPWLVRMFIERLGIFETEQLLISLNEEPRLSVRVDASKFSVYQLSEEFKHHGVDVFCGKFLPNFLYIEGLSAITDTELFKAVTIQDEGAGIVSVLLDPKRGERILDICAAPEEKATHILELTNGDSDVTAIERYEYHAQLLQNTFNIKGYTRAKVVVADGISYTDEALFDKIIVDAPCTELGAVRREPDVKWKITSEDFARFNDVQTSLLENASKLLKPGGAIVYSTSSIVSEENQDIVHKFLDNHPEFVIESADRFVNKALVGREGFVEIFPHRHDMDGCFAARLKKVS